MKKNEPRLFDLDKIGTEDILSQRDAWSDEDSRIWPALLAELVDILADHIENHEKKAPEKAVDEARKIIIVIAHHLGGRNIYLPKDDRLKRAVRDSAVYRAFNGTNHRSLAEKTGLTTAQIYNIISRERKIRKDFKD